MMRSRLQLLKAGIKKSIRSNPKLYREYWYLKSNARYVKRAFSGRSDWKDILAQPPILVGFNTTGVCNADCCYCAYKFHTPDGVMDMEIYEKGVRDFSEMGGGAIGLSPLTGEPLLDPHFSERIDFASQFDNIWEITFDTNGILLGKEMVREKIIRLSSRMKLRMNISLPGLEKEMFEKVYNVKWDDAVLHGVAELLRANREFGKPMSITLAFQPDAGGVLREYNFRSYILPYIDNDDIVSGCELRDNWCGQIEKHHLTGKMTLKRQLKSNNIPCEVLLDRHVDILVNGDVRMCGCRFGKEGKYDDLVVGNIREKSLSEIWYGEGPRRLCERFLESNTPTPCRECSMYLPY
jgi:MoaA/NifB/PqqE/SkfB family radical SAM enzyme